MISDKPNFSKVYIKASNYLATSNSLKKFPFHPKDFVKENGNGLIVCRTYSKANAYGIDINAFGSESAVLTKYHGKYIIFYDDNKNISHVKFSILHEYGHYIFNHPLNHNDKNYGKYEIEANYFAAQLLMPDQIIRELQKRGQPITETFLEETFEVSPEAAGKRIETLSKTNENYKNSREKEYDDFIRIRHLSLINSIKPEN